MTVVADDLRSRPEQLNRPAIPAPRSMNERPCPKAIVDLTLAATSTAVNIGVMFLRHTLTDWQRDELGTNGEVVLFELISQAVTLTGVPEPSPRWTELTDLALIRVRLVLLETGVVVEVADRHDQPPTWADAVTSLCSRWSSYRTNVGRVVWCELAPPTYELTENGLPKRVRQKAAGPNPRPAAPVDVELLRRVREGLEALFIPREARGTAREATACPQQTTEPGHGKGAENCASGRGVPAAGQHGPEPSPRVRRRPAPGGVPVCSR
ncbi:hypothetical protein [Streptomyces sp. TS71-3]|uniref:hypothetical protein n=1 Tax=Streptomyces sp. TS71-3 TaxID=2733862 RepID=UPI001B116E4C|nr:hypothetical protein [Streptomyces sp. TS71-3]GHJ41356.1 hypothetical protein Sm713_69650 [Streptomyces sp. TS71-3]